MDHPQLFTTKATIGSCAALVAIGVMLAAYGPAIERFKVEFSVSSAAVGGAIAVQSLGAVIGVLAAQPVLKRFGNRVTMSASLLLMALGCSVVAVSPAWAVTVAGSAVAGFGLGGCDALTTQLFVFGQGRRGPMLINVVHGCFGLGTVLAPAALAVVGVQNYRLIFGVAAAISVLAAVTMTGLTPRPTPADNAARHADTATSARRSGAVVVVVGGFLALYILHFGVQAGLGSWGPSRLLDLGYSSATASAVIAGYWAAMVIGRFAAAPLAGRVSMSVLVTASCVGTSAAAALAMYGPATVWAYLLAGLCIGPIFPNGLTWLAHTHYAPGAVFAYVIAAAMAGAAVFPPLLGVVMGSSCGTAALAPALLAGSILAAISCAVIAAMLRRHARADSGATDRRAEACSSSR